jgi:hypothetical protein
MDEPKSLLATLFVLEMKLNRHRIIPKWNAVALGKKPKDKPGTG